uniref:Restriction endonuclease n=1 Tax=Candidatus Kentrum sp. LFY TaxID=2126342 RepID=A0A450USF6_9GAMM|nr:MAG: Putative restriction endonuclease [Candidatus Kentron sp. LFY]
MSPATNEHGIYRMSIGEWLMKLTGSGRTISECSIQTTKGVKVADVAWASYDFLGKNRHKTPYPESPEIVIEILSPAPANSRQEMQDKKRLYFAAGAKEVWLCGENGTMAFFSAQGDLPESRIVAGFPERIDIDW